MGEGEANKVKEVSPGTESDPRNDRQHASPARPDPDCAQFDHRNCELVQRTNTLFLGCSSAHHQQSSRESPILMVRRAVTYRPTSNGRMKVWSLDRLSTIDVQTYTAYGSAGTNRRNPFETHDQPRSWATLLTNSWVLFSRS